MLRISLNLAAEVARSSSEQILLTQVQPVKMKRKGTPVYPPGEAERERKNDDSYHEDHERV
jgi:hypothetical protein